MNKKQREAFQSLPPQQQKLAMLIVENLKKEKPDTIQSVMLAAGYAQETAEKGNQTILRSKKLTKALEPIADEFGKICQQALKEVSNRKLKSSSAESLLRIADLAHKNSRLANGESTENVIQVSIDM